MSDVEEEVAEERIGSEAEEEGYSEEEFDAEEEETKGEGKAGEEEEDDYEDEGFDDEEEDYEESVEGKQDQYVERDERYSDDEEFIDDGESVTSSIVSSTTGTTKKKKKKFKKRRGKKKKKKKKKQLSDGDSYLEEGDYDVDPRDRMPDPRMAVRMESARIMSNRFMQRHAVKQQMLMEREKRYRKSLTAKRKKENAWRRKMERSPFLVDQLAENERIDEENRVRIQQEEQRERLLTQRKNKIKNEIILKALAEASDLDGLRKEKRLIAIEEKRLKALLGLEKASGHRKADLMAAQRAERQRKQVQAEYLRAKKREEAIMVRERERELLMEKLDVQEPPAFSYFSSTLGYPKFVPKDDEEEEEEYYQQ